MINFHFQNLIFTLSQAFFSALISIVGGWSLARIFMIYPLWQRKLWIFSFPTIFPSLSVVIGMVSFSQILTSTSLQGLIGIILCHTFLNVPLVMFMFLKGYMAVPASVWQLGLHLRLPFLKQFVLIEWPLLKNILLKSGILIFLFCFTSFNIPLLLSSKPDQSTLNVSIYYYAIIQGQSVPTITLLIIQTTVIYGILWVFNFIKHTPLRAIKTSTPLNFQTFSQPWALTVIVIIFAVFLFFPPFIAIIFQLIQDFNKISAFETLGLACINSMMLGCATAITVISLGILISMLPLRWQNTLQKLSYLSFAIPSFIINLGLFLLVLYTQGRPWPFFINLWLVQVIVNLPLALKIISSHLHLIKINQGSLIQALKLNQFITWKKIYWPQIKPSLRLGLGITSVYAMSDLGGTLLLDQQGFVTLPSLIFDAYNHFDFAHARLYSIALLIISCLFFFICFKLNTSKKSPSLESLFLSAEYNQHRFSQASTKEI